MALHYVDDTGSAKVCCANGHSFDIARQGYINLLSVQDKRSKDPGDTKEMIAARGRVLDSGLYARIADALIVMVAENLQLRFGENSRQTGAVKTQITLLDAGCGEGYYLDRCAGIKSEYYSINAVGLDISKWAVMAAAKRNKDITWLVASNRNPPIQENSIDIIVCGFGFPEFSAFKKLLKPDGCIIMLDPGEEHLLELRKIIYPIIKPYTPNDFAKAINAGFSVVRRERLTYQITHVCQQQLQDILVMSPHLYRAQAEGKEKVYQLPMLDMTIDVNFTILSL